MRRMDQLWQSGISILDARKRIREQGKSGEGSFALKAKPVLITTDGNRIVGIYAEIHLWLYQAVQPRKSDERIIEYNAGVVAEVEEVMNWDEYDAKEQIHQMTMKMCDRWNRVNAAFVRQPTFFERYTRFFNRGVERAAEEDASILTQLNRIFFEIRDVYGNARKVFLEGILTTDCSPNQHLSENLGRLEATFKSLNLQLDRIVASHCLCDTQGQSV